MATVYAQQHGLALTVEPLEGITRIAITKAGTNEAVAEVTVANYRLRHTILPVIQAQVDALNAAEAAAMSKGAR